MPVTPELPRNLCLNGEWAISVTDIATRGADEKLETNLEAVVVSRETLDAYLLNTVILQPKGTALAPLDSAHITLVQGKDAVWASTYIPKSNDFFIKPYMVYEILNKVAARKLLSGHLLAIRYNAITRMREIDKHLDVASRWDKEFKFLLGQGEESLTKFTALSYKALTDWLETSPAQLLATVEGVSVTTIRNRIYAAREIGAIEKPGAGVRSAKKPNVS
jgi:hypothetical protein